MIEASFAAQYGIRLTHEPDISYAEFSKLLAGLMQETPLGHVVSIRMEKDPKILKSFGAYEKKVRTEWALFKSKNMPPNTDNEETAQSILKALFRNA